MAMVPQAEMDLWWQSVEVQVGTLLPAVATES